MTFTVWRCMQVYCRMSQTEFVFFLMVRWGNRCLGRKPQRWSALTIILEMNDPHMTSLVMLTSVPPVKVLWVRFLHWKIASFLSICCLFKVLGCQPLLKGSGDLAPPAGGEKICTLFEIIRRICSPHLFIQSFIYISIWIQYSYFAIQIILALAIGSSFTLSHMSLWYAPFVWAFPYYCKELRANLVCSLHQPWKELFLQRDLISFIGEWYLETKTGYEGVCSIYEMFN